VAFWSAPNACSCGRLFPPDEQTSWEKEHWRLDRRRLVRVAVTPEEIGLCGCWQIIAVRRERQELDPQQGESSDEIGYYATSLAVDEHTDEELLQIIRDHWSAIENGVHHRRDVTFGEDACRIADRKASHAMATMRNLAIGLYELVKERGGMKADSCASWRRQMTFTAACALLRK